LILRETAADASGFGSLAFLSYGGSRAGTIERVDGSSKLRGTVA